MLLSRMRPNGVQLFADVDGTTVKFSRITGSGMRKVANYNRGHKMPQYSGRCDSHTLTFDSERDAVYAARQYTK